MVFRMSYGLTYTQKESIIVIARIATVDAMMPATLVTASYCKHIKHMRYCNN